MTRRTIEAPVPPAAAGTGGACPPRCWVTVASRDHVRAGGAGGFMQACHGKVAPLRRMRAGDGVAFYSHQSADEAAGGPARTPAGA